MGGGAPFHLADPAATHAFGQVLAKQLRRGDVLLLSGDLGMGKTALAKAIIQQLAGQDVVVTSPTFALMQPYGILLQDSQITCWHVDLYRLENSCDVEELGLDELQEGNLMLIEWPQRLGKSLPADAIACDLQLAPEGRGRMVTLTFSGRSASRATQVENAIHARL
jgi:tRNA threonylcarbamoyl adenosine modification protein YjeE